MKGKGNEGFTLLETLIAIVVLGIVVVPVCSSLVMSFRINAKADQLLRNQLAVSSVVETLMAEGIQEKYGTIKSDDYGWFEVVEDEGTVDEKVVQGDRFPEVTIVATREENQPYYNVTVTAGDVSVTTQIRAAETTPADPAEGGGT